jgi:predicted PurR-regulated permease PerM
LGAQKGLEFLPVVQQSATNAANSDSTVLSGVPALGKSLDFLRSKFPMLAEKVGNLQQISFGRLLGLAAGVMSSLVREIPGLVIQLFVMLVSLYYFLVDGERLTAYFKAHSVFSRPMTQSLLRAIHNNAKSVVLATVISGLAQAAIMALALLATGSGNIALLCFAVFICSFLPLIGTSPVTFGTTLYMFMSGDTSSGVIMLIAAIIISLVDNIIRPAVLKGRANLHPLLGFVSAFGGLTVLGFYGLFLGPIVAGIVFAMFPFVVEDQASAASTSAVLTTGRNHKPRASSLKARKQHRSRHLLKHASTLTH